MINIMQVVSKRKLLNHFVIIILLLHTMHLFLMEFYEDIYIYISWTVLIADIKTINDCNLCITVPLFSFRGSPTRCWVYSLELSRSHEFMWAIHWACKEWRKYRSVLSKKHSWAIRTATNCEGRKKRNKPCRSPCLGKTQQLKGEIIEM